MVAQPVIPLWIRLVVHCLHENSIMLLPTNYRFMGSAGSSITSAMLDALISGWIANVQPTLLPMMAPTFQITNVDATDRSIVAGAYANQVEVGVVGTLGSDAMPANVADVISWRTGLSGRANRGRTYTFGSGDNSATGSLFTSAYTGVVTAFAATQSGYLGPVSCPVKLAVASISQLKMIPITSFTIDNIADSQRRRLPGRGN